MIRCIRYVLEMRHGGGPVLPTRHIGIQRRQIDDLPLLLDIMASLAGICVSSVLWAGGLPRLVRKTSHRWRCRDLSIECSSTCVVGMGGSRMPDFCIGTQR
jgi:hypothetical protein